MSESNVQAAVRILASARGWRLWRNNKGVLPDANGRPVRFGLCNDSAELGKRYASADLIGIMPVLVTQEMVGRTLGVFVSLECKEPGWTHVRAGNKREVAQAAWRDMVRSLGGYAEFTTGTLPGMTTGELP